MTNLVKNIDDDISFGDIVGIRKYHPTSQKIKGNDTRSFESEKQYIVMNHKDYGDTRYTLRYLFLKIILQPYIRSMNSIEDMNVILQYEKKEFYNDEMYLYCVNKDYSFGFVEYNRYGEKQIISPYYEIDSFKKTERCIELTFNGWSKRQLSKDECETYNNMLFT